MRHRRAGRSGDASEQHGPEPVTAVTVRTFESRTTMGPALASRDADGAAMTATVPVTFATD